MKTCETMREWMSEHLDGVLDDARRDRLVAHLGQCPDCQREWRDIQKAIATLQAVPEVEPPPDLLAKIHERLANEGRKRVTLWNVFAMPQMQVALAASLLLAVGVFGLLELRSPRAITPPQEAPTDHMALTVQPAQAPPAPVIARAVDVQTEARPESMEQSITIPKPGPANERDATEEAVRTDTLAHRAEDGAIWSEPRLVAAEPAKPAAPPADTRVANRPGLTEGAALGADSIAPAESESAPAAESAGPAAVRTRAAESPRKATQDSSLAPAAPAPQKAGKASSADDELTLFKTIRGGKSRALDAKPTSVVLRKASRAAVMNVVRKYNPQPDGSKEKKEDANTIRDVRENDLARRATMSKDSDIDEIPVILPREKLDELIAELRRLGDVELPPVESTIDSAHRETNRQAAISQPAPPHAGEALAANVEGPDTITVVIRLTK